MLFPQGELGPGETVRLHVHPHGSTAARGVTFGALALVAAPLVSTTFTATWAVYGTLGCLGLFVLAALQVVVRWRTTHYIITNERVIWWQGLIARTSREARISMIENIVVWQTVRQRIVGSGTLVIETGQSSIQLDDVPSVAKAAKTLRLLMEGRGNVLAAGIRTTAARHDDHAGAGNADTGVGHVFICYSRTDRAYVDRLSAHLRAAGISPWYDFEVVSGERFVQVIQNRIDTCSALVVVLSPESLSSLWVEREISYAALRHKPILPLRLAGAADHILLAHLSVEEVRGGEMPGQGFLDRLRQLQASFPGPVTSP